MTVTADLYFANESVGIFQGNPDDVRPMMNESMARSVASGVFRVQPDPTDLHASTAALTFFDVSNQHIFGLSFNHDGQRPEALAGRHGEMAELIARFVCFGLFVRV